MFCGHLDSTIGEVIRARPSFLSRFENVLITCLDSVREIATTGIAREVIARYPACTVVPNGLLVPGALVSNIDQAVGLFAGFDEVWCFRNAPLSANPQGVSVLPPPGLEPGAIPINVMELMIESHCMLAMGDGFGMNYVTPDQEIERELQEIVPR